MAGIFTSDDYPPQSLDRDEEGIVGIVVKVDEHGGVSDCFVESSSGFAALDVQTCRLVWLRAKFKPAQDAKGMPIAGEVHTRISWRIGEDWTPSEPWASRMITTLGRDGKPLSCRVELEGAIDRKSVV